MAHDGESIWADLFLRLSVVSSMRGRGVFVVRWARTRLLPCALNSLSIGSRGKNTTPDSIIRP